MCQFVAVKTPLMNIGNRIQKIRTLKGFSQASVAHILGISQRQLSRIENNQSDIKFSTLDNICAALEIKLEELLNFDEQSLFHIQQKPIENNIKLLSQVLIKQYENRIHHLEQEVVFLRKLLRKKG